MTWHTDVVAVDRVAALVSVIRSGGGTVTSCRRTTGGVAVTWTTPDR
jgi:hypothetical protein